MRFLDLDGVVLEVAAGMDNVVRRKLRKALGAEEVQLRPMLALDRIQNLAQNL